MIESKGIRLIDGFRSGNCLKLWRIFREPQQILRELHNSTVTRILREPVTKPERHFVLQSRFGVSKGQPEGFALKSRTGKLRVAYPDFVSGKTAGHNNSNLTPLATTVVSGEWELLQKISSHFVFIPVITRVLQSSP